MGLQFDGGAVVGLVERLAYVKRLAFELEVVFDEELVVLSGPEITDLSTIDPARTKMIVLGKGSFYHQHLESILAQRGIKSLRLLELGTLEVIMGCVASGLGVTLLPKGVIGLLGGSLWIVWRLLAARFAGG